MGSVRNASIRTKLIGSFIVAVTFLGLMGVVSTLSIKSINSNAATEELTAAIEEAIEQGKVVNQIAVIAEVSKAFENLSINSQDTLDFMNNNVSKDYDLLIETGIRYEKDSVFISEVFHDTAAMSQQLNAATQEISSVIQNVVNNMNSASASSEEAKRGMNETIMALEQIASAANSQATIAERLKNSINVFKI